jgi:hypothetical protein
MPNQKSLTGFRLAGVEMRIVLYFRTQAKVSRRQMTAFFE